MAAMIDLNDPTLFGKVSAEDEDESVFASYQVERNELPTLLSDKVANNLVVVSAFRGEGKSALLRMAVRRLESEGKVFIKRITATSITVDKASPDVALLTRLWKASIYNYLAKEVGARIGFAWQDDSMGLVEFAQNSGLKNKPWLIALFDRFKLKVPGVAEVSRSNDVSDAAAEGMVKQWTASNEGFWLFIDDIDANFKDTKESRAKLMGFFQAVREIRNETPMFRIRATIRPNVWAILRSEFPDSGKLKDYFVDLNWSEEQIRDLLAARIRAYLVRREGIKPITDPRQLIALCFQDPMLWGGKHRPPHVVLNTFCRSRPRWLIEICKAASTHVVRDKRERIQLSDITEVIGVVGKTRQDDLATEYEPQCKHINEIFQIFAGEDEEYSTEDLFGLIERKLLADFKPEIAGAGGTGVTPQVVVRLLFEIGFLTAKKRIPGARKRVQTDGYLHISFADDAHLITATGPVPTDVRWELHPIFRQALNIRDSSGKIVRPRSH
jgi:hypothetical protein